MSKSSEWVNRDALMEPTFAADEGQLTVRVGWTQPDPDKPRVPTLEIKSKKATLLPHEALEFASWIKDTYGNG